MNINLPIDGSSKPMQLTPAVVALARTVDSSISSSTEITFDPAASIIRCYATTQDVYLKWGTDDVTASNFDEVIPAGQVVDLGVPVDTSTGALFTACNVIERSASAAIVVIEK